MRLPLNEHNAEIKPVPQQRPMLQLVTLALLSAPGALPARATDAPVQRITPPAVSSSGVAADLAAAAGQVLVLSDGPLPVGLLVEREGQFELRWPAWWESRTAADAFLIGGDVAAQIVADWPGDAALTGRVVSSSPGQRVWIDRGARAGIRAGDWWWQRLHGQPVARYEVVHAGESESFCRFAPLADKFQPATGSLIELWPVPGERNAGIVRSAVAFISPSASGAIVWIAAPPWADVPAEPQVEFLRGATYLGCGLVERRDARFWYVRPLDTGAAFAPSVGDTARIRSSADIRTRRFAARVIARQADGFLINAGEQDGLRVGDRAVWQRGDVPLGEFEVRRLQAAHGVVKLSGAAAEAPEPGDIARFSDAPEPDEQLGLVSDAPYPRLVVAKLAPGNTSPLRLCALRRGDATIGLALALARVDDAALLYVIPESASAAPQRGDRILRAGRP